MFNLILILWLFMFASSGLTAQLDWNKDWEHTLAAARNEGQVSVYIYRYERLLADFKKEFPGIKEIMAAIEAKR